MVPRRPVVAAALLSICLAAPTRAQTTRELRDRATDLAYNLDHDEAIRLLHQAIAAAPAEAANHRALAAIIWLNILFQRGAVTVDHYLGSFSRATVDVKNPPKELDAEFKRESARAVELAEQRAPLCTQTVAHAVAHDPVAVVHHRAAHSLGTERRIVRLQRSGGLLDAFIDFGREICREIRQQQPHVEPR